MNKDILFSIIVPAHNRAWCIERALISSANFLMGLEKSEVIVIDDGSTDSTAVIASEFFEKNASPKIQYRILQHPKNLGVCAAKNTGARAARGEWLIFLDSDDELIPSAATSVQIALKDTAIPLHFFGCIDEFSHDIQCIDNRLERGFNDYLRHGTDGEKLPVVKTTVFNEHPYDEDMPGYESLSYMRIIKKHRAACLHSLSVRRYYTSHSNRLSSKANFQKRSSSLAKGHLRVLNEHYTQMSYINIFRQALKYIKSKIISVS